VAVLKTQKTTLSVDSFISTIEEVSKKEDTRKLLELFNKVTKQSPAMWGPAIIGYGSLHLVYESGRELDWFPIGFSPRKQALTLYVNGGWEQHKPLIEKIHRCTFGKGCLYIKSLKEVDMTALESLIEAAWKSSNS
jgi:hypothetical protein